jgi:hypothetical protein
MSGRMGFLKAKREESGKGNFSGPKLFQKDLPGEDVDVISCFAWF